MSASQTAQSQTPALWEGALEEARSLIGVDLRRRGHSWNTQASPDSVRHFCWGIGDENPLICGPSYGAGTKWQSALAPGCFLCTIDSTVVAPKLRGIQWLYGGTDWEWYRPIRHREELRGGTARFWENVEVGVEIQPMLKGPLKGPLNITDMICWYAGGGHTYQAHRRATMHRKRHPGDAFVDKKTGAQDNPARGHAEAKMARDVGMPGSYDVGPQRISWLGQLMTNWIGDDGFLRRLNVSLRRPNIFGDVSWCRATIADKRIEDGAHLLDLELSVVNQLDETTATGIATVELPSKRAPKRA